MASWWSIFRAKLNKNIDNRKQEFVRQSRYSENRHLVIMTCFFLGAVWISWKIEEKYDKMRIRARSTKSTKTRQIEV